MYGGRFTSGQSSAVRKSRVEGKPSMLPKPRRPGSIDRASTDARRPSASHRSSSAEPARATLGGRLSREASATKLSMNRISKSQQDRYGQSSVTPLRTSHYPRSTTTPVRTPSEDRSSRSWQASVERALAFLTVRDQRAVSNVSWQRAECARASALLSSRGAVGAGAGGSALVRPLTIARFVDLAAQLLSALMRDTKLNTDNYVAKLPTLAKRFLYPGAVSKSWLKTVNTLHAFPHALAFICYFLDLVTHVETPVSDEWLYLEKDELACLRRDYLYKCWIRFQDPGHAFEDLNEEYLAALRALLGDDEQRIIQLREIIDKCEATLEDEGEIAARAAENRLRSRRDALLSSVRAVRSERRDLANTKATETQRRSEYMATTRALDADIAAATAEIQQLKAELEQQSISVAERAKLLDEVDYATRVIDSKRTLAEQLSKMVISKETELALWQKRTLDSCVEYKQGLIHLAAHFPPLAALAVDEKELMEVECAEAVSRAVETLRAHERSLAERRAQRHRERSAVHRERAQLMEETRAEIAEVRASVELTLATLASASEREAREVAAGAAERLRRDAALRALAASHDMHDAARRDQIYWDDQLDRWRTRLAEMNAYIEKLREETNHNLQIEKKKMADRVKTVVHTWQEQLDRVEALEREQEIESESKAAKSK